jgi:hypothetical protein
MFLSNIWTSFGFRGLKLLLTSLDLSDCMAESVGTLHSSYGVCTATPL